MYKTVSKRMQANNIRVGNRAAPLLRGRKEHFCHYCKQWFTAEEYRKHQSVSGKVRPIRKKPKGR
jgi:hypothetical protein